MQAEYGEEAEGKDGLLTVHHDDGSFEQLIVPSNRGHYEKVFQHVYDSIRQSAPYYVSEDEIVWQLDILGPNKGS